MPVNDPRGKGDPRPAAHQEGSIDLHREAEEVRARLQTILARTSRLIAALKNQRRQGRAVRAAAESLRRLGQP